MEILSWTLVKRLYWVFGVILFTFLAKANVQPIEDSGVLGKPREDQIHLLYFWATWCPDCKDKLKSDLSVYQKPLVNFMTMPTDKDKGKVEAFVAKNQIQWPVYFDPERKLQKEFKVFSVPTLVVAKVVEGKLTPIKSITGNDWKEVQQLIEQMEKGI